MIRFLKNVFNKEINAERADDEAKKNIAVAEKIKRQNKMKKIEN